MNYQAPKLFITALFFTILVWSGAHANHTPLLAHAQDEFSCDNVSEISQAECEALVAFTTANPQLANEDWLTTSTPCSWAGISCAAGVIEQLQLANLSLQSIPPEIGNLYSLWNLDLSNNTLSILPVELNNLSGLMSLDLSDNNLTAAPDIQPDMLDDGTSTYHLGFLDLSNNQLTELPSGVREQYDSGFLSLELEGNSVPVEVLLGNEDGYFDCTTVFEPSQAECEALVAIFAANVFPFLDLDEWVRGDNPCEWEGVTCADGHITELRLSNEGLTEIPTEVESLTFLQSLDLSDNDLTSLPPAVNSLPALETLNISGNPLAPTDLDVQAEPKINGMNIYMPTFVR